MELASFIKAMPKVELHVHMEGSIQPETLLTLAKRNGVELPATDIDGLKEWYAFKDFDHFIQIYLTICRCICTADDIELIAKEFLVGQAKQNIIYTEATYTAQTHYDNYGISFEDQLAALNRAKAWAEKELNVSMNLVIDISRHVDSEKGNQVADWVVSGKNRGVVALGLGGPEAGNPPEKFAEAFAIAKAAQMASVPHAGEVAGPESVRGALDVLDAVRIGHGVRCFEDPELVTLLKERQIPLEVCPTSNICLKVFPDLKHHILPKLVEAGLYVTINSDDPPMFNTSLTHEFQTICDHFGYGPEQLKTFVLNAANAALLDNEEKAKLVARCEQEFTDLV